MADFQTQDHTIPEVLAAVEAGTITPTEALEQETARGDEARSSLVEKLVSLTQPKEEPVAKAKEKTVRVRTNPEKVRGQAAFWDGEQAITIGSEPVEVKQTAFVKAHLLTEELVQVDE